MGGLISRKALSQPFSTAKLQKILNIVTMKLDLDSWRLIVSSCVFTALSRVFPAMLCGFIISLSWAVWHLQEHTMQVFLWSQLMPTRAGQKASSTARAENQTKALLLSPLASRSGEDTERIWKVWELPLCKGYNVQRDFLLLEKRGENDEACVHVRIFYCKTKRSYFQPLNAKE